MINYQGQTNLTRHNKVILMVFFLPSVAVDVRLPYSKTGCISVTARKQERKYLGEWSSWMTAKRPLGQEPCYKICLDVMGTRPQVSQQQGKCTSWWSLASIIHCCNASSYCPSIRTGGKMRESCWEPVLPLCCWKQCGLWGKQQLITFRHIQWPLAFLKWLFEQYFMLI